MTAIDLDTTKLEAEQIFQRKRLIGFGLPAVIFAYLVYIFFAFDLAGLAGRANVDNAKTLTSDIWSYKVHVTRNNRSGDISYAVEGERKGT
ncbi:MAG: phosphonate ABC transporter, permease protein PhnE, partial [Yoonia sp.]